MGSGHFLVSAVDYLSDYIVDLIEYAPAVPDWLNGEYASPLVERIVVVHEGIKQRAREAGWELDEAHLTDPSNHSPDGAEAVHLRRGQEPFDRGVGEGCRYGCTASRPARRCRSWTTICGTGTR